MEPVLEYIPLNKAHSFHVEKYQQKSFDAPWHYHSQWELTYIIEGSGMAYAGNAIRHFVPGELVLLSPNLPHCWNSNVNSNASATSLFVQWDNNLLGEGWLTRQEFNAIKKMLDNSHTGIIFDSSNIAELTSKLIGLQKLPAFARLIQFLDLLNCLAESHYKPLSDSVVEYKNKAVPKRIETILEYIAENYQQRITAEDMSVLTNLTAVSFSKYFKKTFNKPFTRFLNEYRISQACVLLIEDDNCIEEIAHRCGYNNMAFFHRQFKEVMLKTPLGYRHEFRKVQY
ncbi:AraC family transcriptional regulator [Psychromonas sp. MME2]|uniref:AraC family transcriptional regulator n=1 Tax=unclassified Psychromonas TaxID=2614957 RepID=UPI00339D107D